MTSKEISALLQSWWKGRLAATWKQSAVLSTMEPRHGPQPPSALSFMCPESYTQGPVTRNYADVENSVIYTT